MRDTIEEQWLPIEGYEGYEVSNLGRVKRVKGYDSLGHLRNEKILKPKIEPDGYLRVHLHKEGKGKLFMIHRLVAQAFITNLEGLPQINHKDEDKTNNIVDNLEWCTARYNSNYGTRTERIEKNKVKTRIRNGNADPELCGIKTIDRNKYERMRYQKNLEKVREHQREYKRKYRLKKKQEKKKDNHPSEESLW